MLPPTVQDWRADSIPRSGFSLEPFMKGPCCTVIRERGIAIVRKTADYRRTIRGYYGESFV